MNNSECQLKIEGTFSRNTEINDDQEILEMKFSSFVMVRQRYP